MIASRIIPLAEEEGVEVDGAKGVGGAADPDCLERNCASLRLTVASSIAPIKWKWLDKGKGIEEWRKILVISERKMSLSRVAKFLCTSIIERMK